MSLTARYREVVGRVAAAAAGRPLTLIAVSKTQPPEAIQALYELGQRDFGENYAQELIEKASALAHLKDLRWHFIGHLQTNKVKAIIPHVHAVHSVDSERLAAELAKRWDRPGQLPCFVEVNIDGESSKSGVSVDETPALARKISESHPGLKLQGLMAIPAAGDASGAFARLRELETKCRPFTNGGLSMGMSSDYEQAIPQGATHVRVGTALFGARA